MFYETLNKIQAFSKATLRIVSLKMKKRAARLGSGRIPEADARWTLDRV
jgi:hypothetical protein